MHELLVDLFPWVLALWVAEGLAQPGRGHLLLVAGPGGRFEVRRAGLHLLGASPFTEVIAAHDLPYVPAVDGVLVHDPRARFEPALVAADDLREIPLAGPPTVSREGRRVRVAGELAVVAPTAAWAERIRADLAAVAEGGPPPRPGRLDVAAARALRDRQRRWVAVLRAIAGAASALALVAWPVAAWAPDRLPLAAGPLLGAIGLLVLAAAGTTWGMLRACGESRGTAAAAALHLAAYPIAALRPLLHASRSLYRAFDALAIAAALLPREDLRVLAGRELWRARLSRDAAPPALARAWQAREREIVAVLRQVGMTEAEALAPEAPSADAASACPLCGAQYRAGFERCKDCGVGTVAFQKVARAPEA